MTRWAINQAGQVDVFHTGLCLIFLIGNGLLAQGFLMGYCLWHIFIFRRLRYQCGILGTFTKRYYIF
jgi:hypothetical protein